jgi:hypothetical protein
MAEKEPTQRTEKGLEIPVPTRKDWDKTLSKIVKPAREVEEAAEQEIEYPEDETNEG